jgi:hypothetical protein
MHIGVVGGLERNVLHCADLALARGHSFEWHAGHPSGRGQEMLESLVERSDLIVVVTDVNSHAGVLGARRLARARARPLHLVRRFGVAAFRRLLEQLDDAGTRDAPAVALGRRACA